jgi:predicted esterase
MKSKLVISFIIGAFFATGILCAAAGQDDAKTELVLTGKTITIDGDLSEWTGIREYEVNITPQGKTMTPSDDITVTARFTYDAKNFYTAVRVTDDTLEFPNRSWRYGDGFYLTFVDSPSGNGELFTTFGFSRQDGEDEKALVNRNGVYFPGESLKYLEMKTAKEQDGKVMLYELAIPWDYLVPFQPFFRDSLAVNLTYVDQDEERREDILQLVQDESYDTEATSLRKGRLFELNNRIPENTQVQSLMNATHFYHDEGISLQTAVNSPREFEGWQLRIILTSGAYSLDETQSLDIVRGMNRRPFALPGREYESGSYDLSLGVVNGDGDLIYSRNHTFFILNRSEFQKKKKDLNQLKNEIEKKEDHQKLVKSFSSVAIRFDWVEAFMTSAPAYAEFQPVKDWMDEMQILMDALEEGRPALFPPGRIGRLAYRSDIDDTLQPYSVFVPAGLNPEQPVPLFVTLHGSGVDERTPIRFMVRLHEIYRQQGRMVPMIIMAPKARDLSAWYQGSSGKAVIASIEHLINFYNIDKEKIILDGFSMGGYGAWRLGFLHPDLFRALIIRSGAIVPPPQVGGQNVLDLMQEKTSLDILIVHGDKDQAVPVDQARRAVERLKKLGMDYKYIEVDGAGHGNYDKSEEIFRWLVQTLDLQLQRRRIRR